MKYETEPRSTESVYFLFHTNYRTKLIKIKQMVVSITRVCWSLCLQDSRRLFDNSDFKTD